jgi:hypothetical protein
MAGMSALRMLGVYPVAARPALGKVARAISIPTAKTTMAITAAIPNSTRARGSKASRPPAARQPIRTPAQPSRTSGAPLDQTWGALEFSGGRAEESQSSKPLRSLARLTHSYRR